MPNRTPYGHMDSLFRNVNKCIIGCIRSTMASPCRVYNFLLVGYDYVNLITITSTTISQ